MHGRAGSLALDRRALALRLPRALPARVRRALRLPGLATMDEHIGTMMARTQLVVLGIVVLVLSIENLPRLLDIADKVDRPLAMIARLMLCLVPEYAATGLLLSLFLGVALTARRLAMNSELDILMATGVSPWRIRRSAMLLAVLTTLMVLGVRGWIEPVGEARLDRLLGAIRAGDYGAAIRPGTPIIIGRHATLLAERIDPTTHRLYRVFVHSGAQTATAAMGRMLHDRRDRIVVALTDGTLATHAPGEAPRSTGFGTLTLVFPSDRPAPALPGAAERLNRLTISALTAVTGADRDAAIAALGGRLVFAGFCLILPVLGFLLGAVPKRRRSAIGLFLGVALIVLFLRMAAMIEADLAAIALPAFAALLGGWAGAVLLLDARLARHGPGAAEAWLATIAARAMRPIRP